ncbi:pentapeptide repeat-containing protein [Rhizobium sp. 12,4]|uniref:pentapeptide repeat-containing protein n=1 Tax=Rhizobium sp. 12,4 TaxID=3405135 RepID=UPI003D34F215
MKFDILNRFSGEVQITAEIDCAADTIPAVKLGLAVKWAIKEKKDLGSANLRSADLGSADLGSANLRSADLRSADLRSADLGSANLYGADLGSADLGSANLRSADLRSADLRSADLRSANLYGADLGSANLRSANLRSADLGSANLRSANLYGADLGSANLRSANLRSADLGSANLYGADLGDAKNAELPIAQTRILPEGSLIGWKKCQNGVIVKLRIPEEAKRSHAFGRKCRAEFADVVEVIGSDVGISMHDYSTEYRTGQRVTPDRFDENWMEECAPGIHFFISRIEAENY